MVTLNDINFLVSYLRPDVTMRANELCQLLHDCQLEYFAGKLQAFEQDRILSKDMEPFKVNMGDLSSPLVIDANGHASKPLDYFYATGMRVRRIKNGIERWKRVDMLTDKEFNERVTSALIKPNFSHPVCVFRADYIRFEPKNVHFAHFDYLRLPVIPVYGISTDRGYQEYDPETSTELEWNDISKLEITILLLQKLSVRATKDELTQILTNKQKESKQ